MSASMTFTCETPEALYAEIKNWTVFLEGGYPATLPTEAVSFPAAPLPETPVALAPTSPPSVVPTTPAPSYTLDQITLAGANLVTVKPDMMGALMAMLPKYGVQTLAQLQPEQFGAVATELRALGANI